MRPTFFLPKVWGLLILVLSLEPKELNELQDSVHAEVSLSLDVSRPQSLAKTEKISESVEVEVGG